MTIDITIGKLVCKDFNEYIKSMQENEGSCINYFCSILDVEQMDNCIDGTDKKLTICSGESYRTGSEIGMGEWLKTLNDLYNKWVPCKSNDRQISLLIDVIEDINLLEVGDSDIDKDMMIWLKFWANKAVKEYGDKAAIMFT